MRTVVTQDPDIIQDARQLHNHLWGIPPWAKYSPSPTPISLGREDMATMTNRPGTYMVTAKTDGERCSLVLGYPRSDPTRMYAVRFNRAGHPVHMVLRGVSPVCLPEDARADILCGTLLDCEWLKDTQTLVLLDTLCICGYDLKSTGDFRKRMTLGALVVDAIDMGPIKMRCKPFMDLEHIGAIDPEEGADGLVFMPTREKVHTGRSMSIFKWKAVHTVDAMFEKGRFVFRRQATSVPVSDLGIQVDIDDTRVDEGHVYELKQVTHGTGEEDIRHFQIMCRRDDKIGAPNQVDTVHHTLLHIDENLTHEELTRTIQHSYSSSVQCPDHTVNVTP